MTCVKKRMIELKTLALTKDTATRTVVSIDGGFAFLISWLSTLNLTSPRGIGYCQPDKKIGVYF